MMPLPQLASDYLTTLTTLHQASMLMGPIQNAVLEPRANYLHLPLWVHRLGLDSQMLPGGVAIHMDFCAGEAIIVRPSGEIVRFAYTDHSQYSLFAALLNDLRRDVLADFFADASGTPLPEFLMIKLHAAPSRVEFLHIEDVSHREPLVFNAQTGKDYAALLDMMYTAFARFRARLKGHLTPIMVWPEHFDLSTLWFAEGDFDDHKAQMNFGFAPFSDGLPYPYLYVTAYPYHDNVQVPALPAGALWHSQGWSGVIVPYQEIAAQSEPVVYVELLLRALFPVMHSLMAEMKSHKSAN